MSKPRPTQWRAPLIVAFWSRATPALCGALRPLRWLTDSTICRSVAQRQQWVPCHAGNAPQAVEFTGIEQERRCQDGSETSKRVGEGRLYRSLPGQPGIEHHGSSFGVCCPSHCGLAALAPARGGRAHEHGAKRANGDRPRLSSTRGPRHQYAAAAVREQTIAVSAVAVLEGQGQPRLRRFAFARTPCPLSLLLETQ